MEKNNEIKRSSDKKVKGIISIAKEKVKLEIESDIELRTVKEKIKVMTIIIVAARVLSVLFGFILLSGYMDVTSATIRDVIGIVVLAILLSFVYNGIKIPLGFLTIVTTYTFFTFITSSVFTRFSMYPTIFKVYLIIALVAGIVQVTLLLYITFSKKTNRYFKTSKKLFENELKRLEENSK